MIKAEFKDTTFKAVFDYINDNTDYICHEPWKQKGKEEFIAELEYTAENGFSAVDGIEFSEMSAESFAHALIKYCECYDEHVDEMIKSSDIAHTKLTIWQLAADATEITESFRDLTEQMAELFL